MTDAAQMLRALLIRNVDDVELRRELRDPLYDTRCGSVSAGTAARKLGAVIDVLPPGKRGCPYHLHHAQEELFVILEGEGTYRFGDAEYAVKAGDVCAAPTGGPETAHQIINTGTTTLKYLGLSTQGETEVVEYPDSGKVAVMNRFDWSTMSGGIRHIFHSGDAARDYYDGEC